MSVSLTLERPKITKGIDMPTSGKRPRLERTQKAKEVSPGAPLLETRARSILSTMVSEVAAEPDTLHMPEEPPMVAVADGVAAEEPSLDDMPTRDLAEIARQGGSLELDGARHDAAALETLARNVKDEAHLKINNSGTFSADELARIARSAPGQVIFA